MRNEKLKMVFDMKGKASIIVIDNRTKEDHESDDMRRMFGLQRAYLPTAIAISPIDIGGRTFKQERVNAVTPAQE